MVWSLADERFQENLAAARVYFAEHWTPCAPRSASALDRPVGQWLSNLRRPGALEGRPEWEAGIRQAGFRLSSTAARSPAQATVGSRRALPC
ncbi:helicase associated domain-containing protein [Streptomyces uncialis]|uniref:helicase associated domain-containing protein n=1 Tax=Streptomyces uncialis TaxID=1048205 RepID=UPI0038673DCD